MPTKDSILVWLQKQSADRWNPWAVAGVGGLAGAGIGALAGGKRGAVAGGITGALLTSIANYFYGGDIKKAWEGIVAYYKGKKEITSPKKDISKAEQIPDKQSKPEQITTTVMGFNPIINRWEKHSQEEWKLIRDEANNILQTQTDQGEQIRKNVERANAIYNNPLYNYAKTIQDVGETAGFLTIATPFGVPTLIATNLGVMPAGAVAGFQDRDSVLSSRHGDEQGVYVPPESISEYMKQIGKEISVPVTERGVGVGATIGADIGLMKDLFVTEQETRRADKYSGKTPFWYSTYLPPSKRGKINSDELNKWITEHRKDLQKR